MDAVVRRGIGVSPGIAIAPALVLERRLSHVPKFDLAPEHVEQELKRLQDAVAATRRQLAEIEHKAGLELGSTIALIIDAQRLMLEDEAFLTPIRDRIRKLGQNAEWAVKLVGDGLSERFSRLSDPYLRQRANDLDDLAGRLVRTLSGSADFRLDNLVEPVVLVAYDLSPSDTAMLDRSKIAAFVMDVGGRTSHTAIMARSLEIPAIVGLHDATERVRSGAEVIIDGNEGTLVIGPTPALLKEYRNKQAAYADREDAMLAANDLPATTPDGVSVALLANIESASEAAVARRYGATGVGLFRSEYLYLRKPERLPTEQEHFIEYRDVLAAMVPDAVSVRTLDLGGEKDLPGEFKCLQGSDSLLGVRAIRHSMQEQTMFVAQLRGLLRASVYGNLRIILPFISGVEELRAVKTVIADVRRDLEAEGAPVAADIALGVMIEVPSAALVADHLAQEVDFFSIGTNDLIQYLLAVDRNNDAVSHLYEPLHPAVLRLLDQVVRVAREAGIPVSLCGETASDPLTAMVYLGLCIDEFSMSPSSIPVIRKLVRNVPHVEMRRILTRSLQLRTAREVEEFALEQLMAHFPDGFMTRC